MIRRIFVLLFLFALIAPFRAVGVHAAVVSPEAARIVDLINARRATAGLPPVQVHSILMGEAQRFSGVQAQLGKLNHRGADNTNAGQRLTKAGYRWKFYGENLAAGQNTPEEVVTAWMNSPTHRANILHAKAREIGIGHTVYEDDPTRYVDYWVMEVASPR